MWYPGGEIIVEPYNLGKRWVGYDFARGLGKPVRLINDAAMQAAGSYRGSCMLFLSLGTGFGATLILDDVIAPLEIGQLPYKDGMTCADHVGERGRGTHGVEEMVQDRA